jgi:hypothetical protein
LPSVVLNSGILMSSCFSENKKQKIKPKAFQLSGYESQTKYKDEQDLENFYGHTVVIFLINLIFLI